MAAGNIIYLKRYAPYLFFIKCFTEITAIIIVFFPKFCIVIIGFSRLERAEKRLFVYDDIRGKPREVKASQINAYLLDAPNVFIERRLKPLCGVSEILLGNVPRDDGNFFLDKSQRAELLKKEPALKPLIRPFLGSIEFLHNLPRYCLWFDGVSPAVYKNSKEIKERLARIR
ncbi:MAG: hypothetical protein LBG90_05010, partial [Spirochaetaceae bacterium]|nr:hypothetical protein [Spirochaetaceae bacterium]